MNNQETIKTIANYINNEFANVEPINYFDMAPRSFNSGYGGYKASYHIEQDDYSQETFNFFTNSELVSMCDELYSDYHMAMESAIRNNPTEYGYEDDDIEWVQSEDYIFDEEGLEYTIFTNYFISLVQEVLEDAPVEVEYVKHSVSNEQLYTTFKVTYLGVTDEYSKVWGESVEPGQGIHSEDFIESDKLWNAIDEAYSNVEDNILSPKEREELFGQFA